MPVDRLEQSGLNRAWISASAVLPLRRCLACSTAEHRSKLAA